MKNEFVKKVLCVLSAAVLVVSFAACGKNADDEETTKPTVSEEEIMDSAESQDVSVSDSQADNVSESAEENASQTAESEQTKETSAQTGNSGSASSSSTLPDSKAEIIAAYNNAVTKSGLSRTSMSQKLTKGFISVVNYDIMASENAAVLNKINVNNSSKAASDLTALSSGDVQSATRSGNTVTIKLNTVSGKASLTNGAGGYVGVIDNSRTNEIIDIVTADIGVSGVTLASGSYTLSNGVITATFNSDFTKITKVTFTGSESFAGKLKYLVLPINADVAANLSSTYSA